MEKKESIYNPKTVISLIALFGTLFWLLYQLASSLYTSQKIGMEIDAIRRQNEKNLEIIEQKKSELEYLQTPQRIDKEAKLQLGRKQAGENVVVLIREKMDILPSSVEDRTIEHVQRDDITILDKWRWVFFGKKNF